MILPILYVAPSEDKGRGVFSEKDIKVGTVIERSPVLVLSPEERATIEDTHLYNYIFEWGDDYKGACVALGYVSMYNHSYHANCVYEMDFESEIINITVVKPVKAGDELFINYNAVPDDETPIWFDAK